ncbi:MAG: hypothetical protein AB1631_26650 [Acidobacteriota bacterium]
MKAKYFRTFFAVVCAAMLCAATLISSQSATSALAFETKKPIKGQDVGDENCERIDSEESSTFGKCKSVCKDKDVTWDAVGKRYVCSAIKSAGSRPHVNTAPVGDKAQYTVVKRTPKRHQAVDPKAGKAKKN